MSNSANPGAAGPALPRRNRTRSQKQNREVRNGGSIPGGDFWEGARSKLREAAAGDGEGAYREVRDRAGSGENEAQRRLSPRPAALITGGARRIGRAIALDLARRGFDVGFTYRTSGAEALQLEQELHGLGVRAVGIRADLRHVSAAEAAVEAAIATLGRLDVLVNNAGRYETADFAEISDRQWDEMLATNCTAPFLVSRAATPHLRRAGQGRIIHITSIGALRAFPTHAHYCASKAGLAHLTRAMARALAPAISVNAVAPGLIAFSDDLTEWEQKMRDRTPLQRAGTAEDVAEAVGFLATCNPFLTGQTLVVDGGLSLI